MISTYFKTIRNKKLKEINTIRSGSWTNVVNATPQDLETIAQQFGLEYTDLQDSLDVYEIPRIERQDGKLLIFVRYPEENHNNLFTELLTIIVTSKCLVTISSKESPLITTLLKKPTNLVTTQLSKLLLSILLQVSREFTLEIKKVSDRVIRQKRQLEQVSPEDIKLLIKNEEILNQYLSALSPMKTMFQTLLSGGYVKQYQEDHDLFEDLLIDISQSENLCKVSLKSIVSLRDSYQIMFTNSLNKNIQFLTLITILLTIPTVIGSLFGMNVRLPFADNPFAFTWIVTLIAILTVTFLLWFNYQRWFGK